MAVQLKPLPLVHLLHLNNIWYTDSCHWQVHAIIGNVNIGQTKHTVANYIYIYINKIRRVALAFDPIRTFIRGFDKVQHKNSSIYRDSRLDPGGKSDFCITYWQ